VEIAARTALSKSAVGRATADMKTDARARANRQRAAADHAALPWLAEARRLLAGGLTRNRIAARLGVPKTVIYRHL
jgi:DNA-binding NarL/FixJ family response regulator